jgi:ABC-type oligopeptide transport system ATPase subunit
MSLTVENLTVYYQTLKGGVQALEDATFSLGDGEILGLAGESGCGKTTLGTSLIQLSVACATSKVNWPWMDRNYHLGQHSHERFPI